MITYIIDDYFANIQSNLAELHLLYIKFTKFLLSTTKLITNFYYFVALKDNFNKYKFIL
jgi:hypothetical protein